MRWPELAVKTITVCVAAGLIFVPVVGCSAAADVSSPAKFYAYLKNVSVDISENQTTSRASFAVAYYQGIQRKHAKQISEATALFTRAAFSDHVDVPGQMGFADAAKVFGKKYKKSLLYENAGIQLVKMANESRDPQGALALLDNLDANDPQAERRKAIWRGRILLQTNPPQAVQLFEELVNRFSDDAEVLYTAGYAFQKNSQTARALEHYHKTLTFPEIDWTYTLATRQITETLSRKQLSLLPNAEKMRVAEGLRILRKKSDALALFKHVNPRDFTGKDRYLYVQNFSRLLIDTRNMGQLVKFLASEGARFSAEERESLYTEITDRLVKINRYEAVMSVVKGEFSSQQIHFNRLKAVARVRKNERTKYAREYLQKYDIDSFFAEKAYFSVCREKIEKKKMGEALDCLNQLSQITQNAKTGAASLYYQAKHANKPENEIQALYRQVYLTAPEDYYVFKAAARMKPTGQPSAFPRSGTLAEIRNWVANNLSDTKALSEFLIYKRKNNAYAVDSRWYEWEKETSDALASITESEKRALLLYVLGERDEGQLSFKGTDKMRQQLLLAKAGYASGKADLSYFALKHWCRERKVQADIFTMSATAIQTLYPVVYRNIVRKAAVENKIDEARLYGLMKQESGFYASARSYVGALGLMQVMPATAKMLNAKLKIKNLNLLNPEHSIRLGARFYADLNRQYNGVMEYVSSAYNAGPGRLIQWRKTLSRDIDMFTEQIPFAETHFYVKVTRADYDRYALLIGSYYAEDD